MTEEKADNYIQERLDSLHKIDSKVVELLDKVSSLFENYTNDQLKEKFEEQTLGIYSSLSTVAIGLRKEVKLMDNNIGVYNKNRDNLMILPISVDQKNTTLGNKKLDEQLKVLDTMIKGEPNGKVIEKVEKNLGLDEVKDEIEVIEDNTVKDESKVKENTLVKEEKSADSKLQAQADDDVIEIIDDDMDVDEFEDIT